MLRDENGQYNKLDLEAISKATCASPAGAVCPSSLRDEMVERHIRCVYDSYYRKQPDSWELTWDLNLDTEEILMQTHAFCEDKLKGVPKFKVYTGENLQDGIEGIVLRGNQVPGTAVEIPELTNLICKVLPDRNADTTTAVNNVARRLKAHRDLRNVPAAVWEEEAAQVAKGVVTSSRLSKSWSSVLLEPANIDTHKSDVLEEKLLLQVHKDIDEQDSLRRFREKYFKTEVAKDILDRALSEKINAAVKEKVKAIILAREAQAEEKPASLEPLAASSQDMF